VGSVVNRSDFIRAISSRLVISCTALTLGGNPRVSSEIIQFSRAGSSVEESFWPFGRHSRRGVRP
jgi:hypothetical protein